MPPHATLAVAVAANHYLDRIVARPTRRLWRATTFPRAVLGLTRPNTRKA